MLTVIEPPTYLRSIEGILSADEAEEFVDFIATHPDAGDVIRGTNGLCKVRWAASGKGRREGARVIYLVRIARGNDGVDNRPTLKTFPPMSCENLWRNTMADTTRNLDPDALTRWRASDKGWQTRAAAVLVASAPTL